MDMILDQFPKLLKNKLQNHLKKILLFGSRARGDCNDSSDYDFLIIVDKKDREIEDVVLEVSSYLLGEFNELIGFIIWEESEWQFKKRFPIGLNIQKEGRELK